RRAYRLGRLVERLKLTHELVVFACFPEGRDSIAALANRLLTGVVRGERKRQVVVEQIEQVAQIANADPDIRRRVEQLLRDGATRALDDAITNCGGRNDLHQPERALRRHGTGLERRFDGDDRLDERRIERARPSALFDQRSEAADVWMADDATIQRR